MKIRIKSVFFLCLFGIIVISCKKAKQLNNDLKGKWSVIYENSDSGSVFIPAMGEIVMNLDKESGRKGTSYIVYKLSGSFVIDSTSFTYKTTKDKIYMYENGNKKKDYHFYFKGLTNDTLILDTPNKSGSLNTWKCVKK